MRKWAGLALAGTLLVAGCDHFWDKPASGSGNGSGGGSASGVFYVLNQQASKVAGFSFAVGATTPTAVTNSPYNLGITPQALAISPNGNFLYVGTLAGTYAYSIGAGGALTLLNNSQAIDQSTLATAMAVDSTGTWLIVGTSGSNVLHAVPISTTTGLLDTTRSVQTASLPASTVQQIAVTPSGAATSGIFVAMGIGGTSVLTFNTGATNPFGATVSTYKVKNSGGADNAIAVDPSDHLVYVGETLAAAAPQTGGLRVYSIETGAALTEISGSPYSTGGTGPSAILATTSYVYVANRAVSGSNNGNITVFPVTTSGSSYSLGAAINTVSAGLVTLGLAEDNTHTYLLAVNASGSPDLSAFTFDSATGKLVAGPTAATGTDPAGAIAIAAVP